KHGKFQGSRGLQPESKAPKALKSLGAVGLRGLDLNRRPLGYEPFSKEGWSQRVTNKPRKLACLESVALGVFGSRGKQLPGYFLGKFRRTRSDCVEPLQCSKATSGPAAAHRGGPSPFPRFLAGRLESP